jgi:hypothetical protein
MRKFSKLARGWIFSCPVDSYGIEAKKYLVHALELDSGGDQYAGALADVLAGSGHARVAEDLLINFCTRNPDSSDAFRCASFNGASRSSGDKAGTGAGGDSALLLSGICASSCRQG